jgi:hypothetical protein
VNPFQSLSEYERFVYTLQQRYPSVLHTTLTVARRSRGLAIVTGELHFAHGFRLVVSEIVTWDEGPVLIQRYGYEVWRAGEKLYWYDPQPHPDQPELASTHPHHKHVPPDTMVPEVKRSGIKQHRIPAPGLRFDGPNLPLLIEEVERQILAAHAIE